MRNILVGIVLVLLCRNVIAEGAIKECRVGVDPWKSGRQVNSDTEKEYQLSEPLIVVSLNSKGKPSGRCILQPGMSTVVIQNSFDTSVDHPSLPVDQLAWIKGCGNPIISKFKLVKFVYPQIPAPVVAPIVTPPVVVSMEGRECRYGERIGTYRFMDGQMICLIQEVVRVESKQEYKYVEEPPARYYRPPPEVVYYEEEPMQVVYYDEPQQEQVVESSGSSWLPWAIGAGAIAWWAYDRNRGSTPSGPGVITLPAGPGVDTLPAGPGGGTLPAM